MMKKIYKYLFISLPVMILCCVALLMQSCTQCDGDIGPWYGSWHIEAISIDGAEDVAYNGEIIVSFQGKIFNMGYAAEFTVSNEEFGTWVYAGDTLTLSLGYNNGDASDVLLPNGDKVFDPFPTPLHFASGEKTVTLKVLSNDGSKMCWQYTDPEGHLLTYSLRKYP